MKGKRAYFSGVIIVLVLFTMGCGEAFDGDGGNPSCPKCAKWETCGAAKCTFNNASQWDLVALSGTVTQKGPSGSWDTLGGMPDPYICVTANSQTNCTTAAQDTLSPSWNQVLFQNIGGGALMGGFAIQYYDKDLTVNDNICSGNVTIQETYFNQGGVSFSCNYGTLSFSLIYKQ